MARFALAAAAAGVPLAGLSVLVAVLPTDPEVDVLRDAAQAAAAAAALVACARLAGRSTGRLRRGWTLLAVSALAAAAAELGEAVYAASTGSSLRFLSVSDV